MFQELDNDFQKFQQNINQKYNSLTKDNELKDKKISSLRVSKKKLKKQVKELEDKLNKKIEFQKILEQKLENSENEFDRLFNKHVQKIEEVVRYKKKIETIEETHLEEIKIMEKETLTERCAFTQNYNHLIGVLQVESQKVR